VSSSKLPQPLQSEIIKGPLDVFQTGSDNPLCLLSTKQVQQVQNHVQARNNNVFRDVVYRARPNNNNNSGNKRKQNNKRKGNQPNLNWNSDLSSAAQSAGWSTGQGQNKGGRRKQAPKGKKQPFSSNNASNTNK
jgi:hypothetical protein